MKLHYGSNGGRYSWVEYKLGFLHCHGKAPTAVYPSELKTPAEQLELELADALDVINDQQVQIEKLKNSSAVSDLEIKG